VAIFAVIALVCFIVSMMWFADEMDGVPGNDSVIAARAALISLAAIPGALLWPITAPVAMLVGIYLLAVQANIIHK
jgi:hypothetical protein